MKRLIGFLLLVTIGVIFTLLALQDSGFVVIGRGNWSVETSLTLFLIILAILWLLLFSIIRLFQLPWQFLQSRSTHQQFKAQETLLRGGLALLQGQWQTAEYLLLKAVAYSSVPALHYLGAAYSACQLGQTTRAMDYLNKARETLPNDTLPITLFQAKLHLQQQQWVEALKQAIEAYTIAPKQDEVLALLLGLQVQLANWSALLELLPEVRKRKLLSANQCQRLENRASIALIQRSLTQDATQTAAVWATLPKATRLIPSVAKVYVKHLMTAGDANLAESLLRDSLKVHWDKELILLYGFLDIANTSQQISYAESWLKTRANDSALLLTLGRLCMRNRLWGKAQQYLESSVYHAPDPVTYQVLGELLTQLGDTVQATEYYRIGLQLAINNRL